ncbi:DUF6412 domain-containing protein [Streptomyces sp. CRN 30]|uniref:DUF6412 domain-containing protein n=1 Tax=Streptomyces sp. CRN 30 TaxID=3075613 RepID=UPI0039C49489
MVAVLTVFFATYAPFGDGILSVTAAASAVAVALAATALCALVAARSVPLVPPTRVRTAIRDRDRRTAFLPQRDPDAAGRRRPRAPGHALPTATELGHISH